MKRTAIVLLSLLVAIGCAGDDKVTKGDRKLKGPKIKEKRTKDGKLVLEFDHNDDDKPDIIKIFEEYPDPDDPAVTLRRLLTMRIDVNSDGQFNIERDYNALGKVASEKTDTDLNGTFDLVTYYDKGAISRKDILLEGKVDASRYYANGVLLRVERDTNGNGKVDYWEYYEEGVLDRIGRDFNADGRADSWQKR